MPRVTIQKPLDQPNAKNRLIDDLRESFQNNEFTSFFAIVAFAKAAPLKKLGAEIQTWSTEGKLHKVILGLDEHGTSFEALSYAFDNLGEAYVIHGKSSFNYTFHPKIFVFKGVDRTKAYIGSNNLTVGGLELNAESYICLDIQREEDPELSREIDDLWSSTLAVAKKLDGPLLQQLKDSGLVLEERSMRRVREKTLIAVAETGQNINLKPEFKKIRITVPERLDLIREVQDGISEDWLTYGNLLERNCDHGVNLYWNVSKKNNRLEQHIWIIDYLLRNNAPNNSSTENDNLVRASSVELYGGPSMEGTRALMFSKLIGLLENSSPFTVSPAYKALHYPEQSKADSEINSQIISNQLEKFYFWNDISRAYDRHTRSRTAASSYFHIYPLYFIYQVLMSLGEKGYDLYSLSRFEIEIFLAIAKDHSSVEETAHRIMNFRESENMEQIEEFLKAKSAHMDTRFYNILQYSKYFDFSTEIIAIKPEYLNEIQDKVERFNSLITDGRLIEFTPGTSRRYRELLFSEKDLLSCHF